MSRVYIICEPSNNRSTGWRPDLTPARAFGELVTVFGANDYPSATKARAEDGLAQAERALQNFDEDKDYVLWAGGDPVTLFLCGAILSGTCDRVRWLKYQRDRDPVTGTRALEGYYTPVEVPCWIDHEEKVEE